MTIRELKAKITDLPDDMDVFIHQCENDFGHSICESAEVKEISFSEGSWSAGPVAHDKVFLISDENHYG